MLVKQRSRKRWRYIVHGKTPQLLRFVLTGHQQKDLARAHDVRHAERQTKSNAAPASQEHRMRPRRSRQLCHVWAGLKHVTRFIKAQVSILTQSKYLNVHRAMRIKPGSHPSAFGVWVGWLAGPTAITLGRHAQGIEQDTPERRLAGCRIIGCQSTPLIQFQPTDARIQRRLDPRLRSHQLIGSFG